MLIMPILNTNKNNVTRIFNVEVRLKTVSKVRERVLLNKCLESDIIVGSSSFNNSIYSREKNSDNTIVNFIRNCSYKSKKDNFLITTRLYSDGKFYDLYNVDLPPKKISTGLDNLYGKSLLDIQKQVPNSPKGRIISLEQLGVDAHITSEKVEDFKLVIENCKDRAKLDYMLLANKVHSLKDTLDFIKMFDFTIISEATIKEKDFNQFSDIFSYTNGKIHKDLKQYYKVAQENERVYKKLTYLNQLLYEKPLNIIKTSNKNKVLVKKNEQQ